MAHTLTARSGAVLWLTGLSGSGKTTLAKAIQAHLRFRGIESVIVDGDMIRAACGGDCSYDVDGRRRNARRVAGIAKMIADQGVIAVVATVSLYHEIHEWNRNNQTNYFEVLLDVDVATCRSRDRKNIYRSETFESGPNVVGIDIPAEFPRAPHLRLNNSEQRTDMIELAEKILIAAGLERARESA